VELKTPAIGSMFFSQVLETIGSVDCIHTVKKKLVNASDNSLVCSTSEASFFTINAFCGSVVTFLSLVWS
jgi:hypothetical protein